ncbi:MAG: sulfotransferase domain-containing protein [Dongiaceae bacterium]
MIIWLASYPRSGNTLLRIVLRQCFGIDSYSIYNDRTDIAKNAELVKLTGHVMMDLPASQFVRDRVASPELTFIKTHDPPSDDSRAIYIVRDGRAAVLSYAGYFRNIRRRTDVTLADVIRGTAGPFGSWSAHIEAWKPTARPDTLLLRFEDMVMDVAPAIAGISAFAGLAPIAEWRTEFKSLQKLQPDFFTTGSNADIRELEEEAEADFWRLHGDAMRTMGYAAL